MTIEIIAIAGLIFLAAKIYCRRCNAVRGTVADLRELARRSTDAFEF